MFRAENPNCYFNCISTYNSLNIKALDYSITHSYQPENGQF